MSINALVDEYEKWLKEKGHEPMSADELRAGLVEDVWWLDDFIERWEKTEDEELGR